ncbi:MAG: DUF2304 domain-containing protein [Desulfobulbaceae bacterium]|nr:DUF2304 domain-containing protein [Desulfobulbaceae bacterium]
MLTTVALDINRIQYIAIVGDIIFLVFIAELIRHKKIKEAYAILWLFFGAVFLFLATFRSSLNFLAFSCGIAYPPAFLFLVSICSLLLILIQFSMVISSQNDKIKELCQEVALLKMGAGREHGKEENASPVEK